MFYGRESELKLLNDNFNYHGFKMVVVYGRRRVGKSYLLQHFFESLSANIIAFQAIENSASLSIEAFKDSILDVYPSKFDVNLNSWKDCFNYINDNVGNDKLVICIDEINYIFRADNTFASQLQNEIDNHLKNKNVLLIVCGSNVSSIEKEILDTNSPLYGRRNLSIKLNEFDYKEASSFYSSYSSEDKIIAYSVFGGKGKNLASINPSVSIKENIINEILTPGGALADEIDLLLKDDFRDTTFYKELLYVLSLGNTTFNDISTQLNVEAAKVSTYMEKLVNARIVEKVKMINARNSKDYRYYIQDNFFSFYFRFVYKRKNILNILVNPESFYNRFIENDLSSFVGLKFEGVCEQYLLNQSLQGKLDFIPLEYGKYYGKRKNGETFDIDVVLKDEHRAICAECKFTNKEFNMGDMDELIENSKSLKIDHVIYYIFSKSKVIKSVKTNYPLVNIVSLEKLFK